MTESTDYEQGPNESDEEYEARLDRPILKALKLEKWHNLEPLPSRFPGENKIDYMERRLTTGISQISKALWEDPQWRAEHRDWIELHGSLQKLTASLRSQAETYRRLNDAQMEEKQKWLNLSAKANRIGTLWQGIQGFLNEFRERIGKEKAEPAFYGKTADETPEPPDDEAARIHGYVKKENREGSTAVVD